MKEKIVLKSANKEEYGDLVIECKVIPNDKIGEYLQSIPEERKFKAYKSGEVIIREGNVGEKIKTTLTTIVDGREYILSEEEGEVKERIVTIEGKEVLLSDCVVTNISSTSNEEYIVKRSKVDSTYEFLTQTDYGYVFLPKYDLRELTQVDENIIIVTAWGSKAVCLKGGYIVTYNALENDYNVIEKGAFDSTYTKEETPIKRK